MIQWNSMIPKSLMIPWTEIIQKYTVVPLSLMVLFNLFFTFAYACSMSLSNLSLNYCSMWLSWIFLNDRAVSVTSDRVLFNRLIKGEGQRKDTQLSEEGGYCRVGYSDVVHPETFGYAHIRSRIYPKISKSKMRTRKKLECPTLAY